MLQWMGGSRRKVTTSRKSTQKRQKQYFEQRKRQQQQQNLSGLESYTDKNVPYTHHKNNRSLDVLSLLNLSKHGREGSNGEHTSPNYHTARCPDTIQMETKILYPSEHVEVRETRFESNHLEETVCPQENTDASRRNNGKDPMKMTTVHNGLCVIDMLSDDGENSSSRGNLAHENHVAFSVEVAIPQRDHCLLEITSNPSKANHKILIYASEVCPFPAGLGKVEMETPVHSPQHPARSFSYECHKPSKFPNGSHSYKNLNCNLVDRSPELDNMAYGVDVPNGGSLELPPYLEELSCTSKHKLVVHNDCLLHNAQDFLGNDEFYHSRMEQDSFKLREQSSFLDHNFVDDDCGLSWKNWSSDLDSSMINHMRSRYYEKPDFSFEDIHMQKRRASAKAADCFNVSGLPSPLKHQMEHGYDFITSDMTRYPTRHRTSEFSETSRCSVWPSFTPEDSRDRFRFLSDDSCLSHAVWREGTIKPSFNFTGRQKLRGHEADLKRPINKLSTKKNTFTQESWQQEIGNCSRMHYRMPDFSTPGDDWLSGERCSIDAIPGYASMNASETERASFFGCKRWADEPLDLDFNLQFYVDEKPSASRSEHDALSGNLFSDKVAFCQQVSPGHSSPFLSSIKPECGHQESYTGNFKDEKDSPRIQFQESCSTGENILVTLPAIGSTLHQSNYSSSANGTTMNVSDSENNHSYSKETKIKTPEMTPGPNAVASPLHSEGGSSSVEMPQKLEEVDGAIEHANSTQTSLLNQNKHKEDSAHGEGDIKQDGPLSNVDRSCKVMMLGRFVLQLL